VRSRDNLNQPYGLFLSQFGEAIWINKNAQLPLSELENALIEANAKTLEDVLTGFGFRRYQIREDHALVTFELTTRFRPNVRWIGAER